MKKIDVEKLMEEAKILYWQEGNINYHENTIGIPIKSENTTNKDKPSIIKL